MDVREFLGLEATGDPAHWRLPITHGITGGRGALYGGCGLGAVIETAEAATGRPVTWAACQFVNGAQEPQTLDLHFETMVSGRRITQGRVVARHDGEVMLSALVALGTREFPIEGQWGPTMPTGLPAPADCPTRKMPDERRGGLRPRIDERSAQGGPDGAMTAADGRSFLWCTLPGGVPASASALAILGDAVSTGVDALFTEDVRARSIDNSIRVVRPRACEWVLCDIQVDGAADGLAHGTVRMWTPESELLAVTGQSGLVGPR
ncbi:MAG: thioesterase family protein [Acidimicrobiia bacterium]|nr:thioesterase family protein [Acidimicrobiia bacterium]